jgi:integrase
MLNLEKHGQAKTSQTGMTKMLTALAKKVNLDNPDEVNLAIARYKKTDAKTRKLTNTSVSNTYKVQLVYAYSKYVKFYKIQNWEKPSYHADEHGIQPPTDERVKILIGSAKIPFNLKLMLSGETGLRPKEIVGETGLLVKDIHRDTKTIVARSLKGCNPRPPMPISEELLTGLTNYITQKHLTANDPIFNGTSEIYSNHFTRFKKTLAKRLNDPTIEQIRLYDLRHYYITKKLRKIGNAEIVRQIVGHKRLNTTQKYFHLLANTNGEWIVESTTDQKRADELLKQDFTYVLTTPDGYMKFRKPK